MRFTNRIFSHWTLQNLISSKFESYSSIRKEYFQFDPFKTVHHLSRLLIDFSQLYFLWFSWIFFECLFLRSQAFRISLVKTSFCENKAIPKMFKNLLFREKNDVRKLK